MEPDFSRLEPIQTVSVAMSYRGGLCCLIALIAGNDFWSTRRHSANIIPMKAKSKSVIVVGGGISGLAAAQEFQKRGWRVHLLESRNRIGGRIHTESDFDFGAHWIHGTEGNPLTTLAVQHGIARVFTGGDSTYTGSWERVELRSAQGENIGIKKVRKGNPLTVKQSSILIGDELRETLDQWRERRDCRSGDVSIEQAMAELRREKKGGLSAKFSEREALWHLLLFCREDCSADLNELSALNWDAGYEVFGYGDSVVPGGYAQFAKKLSEGLEKQIKLNHVVQRIEYGVDGRRRVKLFAEEREAGTNRFKRRREFEADFVVVTVPLGVLKAKSITFDPPLPIEKQQAIELLGFGCLAKLGYRFPECSTRPWWPANQYVFARKSTHPKNEPTVVINSFASHGVPVLTLLAGGSLGRKLEAMGRDKAKHQGWAWLSKTFRKEIAQNRVREPDDANFFRTGWSTDEYARGAYCFIRVRSVPEDILALAAPVGNGTVLFAGEATSIEHLGNAHGAYLSGLKVAARLLRDESILPARHFTENRHWREARMRAQRFFDLNPGKKRNEGLIQILRHGKIFGSLDDSDLNLLAGLFRKKRVLKDGEILCRMKEPAREMFFVKKGKLVADVGNGKIVNQFEEGSVAGDYGFFCDEFRTATLRAEGKTEVLSLDYRIFRRFLLAFPQATLELFGETTRHLLGRLGLYRSPGR